MTTDPAILSEDERAKKKEKMKRMMKEKKKKTMKSGTEGNKRERK